MKTVEQAVARKEHPEPGLETIYKDPKPLNEIDTEDMQFPNCPWCGFEHYEDYAEFEEGLAECENCSKEFEVSFVTHYTTERYTNDN